MACGGRPWFVLWHSPGRFAHRRESRPLYITQEAMHCKRVTAKLSAQALCTQLALIARWFENNAEPGRTMAFMGTSTSQLWIYIHQSCSGGITRTPGDWLLRRKAFNFLSMACPIFFKACPFFKKKKCTGTHNLDDFRWTHMYINTSCVSLLTSMYIQSCES